MVQGGDGEVLDSVGTAEVQEVELHLAHWIMQLK